MKRVSSNRRNHLGKRDGFDSDLERAVSQANGLLPHNLVKVGYYPAKRLYNPDFLLPVGDDKILLIEVKGHLTEDDRQKYRAVRDNYALIAKALGVSEVELVFVFKNGTAQINPKLKGSATYLEWCEREGFRGTDSPYFPDDWFDL